MEEADGDVLPYAYIIPHLHILPPEIGQVQPKLSARK
jgi:hypothetical protein